MQQPSMLFPNWTSLLAMYPPNKSLQSSLMNSARALLPQANRPVERAAEHRCWVSL